MADKVTGVLNLLKGLVKQTPTSKSTDLVIPTKAELEKLPPDDLEKISNQLQEATNVDRREFLRGALGTIANTAMDVGTLGNLTKMVKPTTKAVAKKLPSIVSFEDPLKIPIVLDTLKSEVVERALKGKYQGSNPELPDFKAMAEDPSITTDELFEEFVGYFPAGETLSSFKKAYEYFRRGAKGNPPNKFAEDLMKQYPEDSAEDIANAIGKTDEAGAEAELETRLFKNPNSKPLAINIRKKIYDWSLIPGMDKPKGFDELPNNQKKLIYRKAVNLSVGSEYQNPKQILRNLSKSNTDEIEKNIGFYLLKNSYKSGKMNAKEYEEKRLKLLLEGD